MDRLTLEMVVRRHQAEIFRYLRYLGAVAEDAEDLVQDVFLAAFHAERQPDLDDVRGTAAWLRAIGRNLFLRHCARRKRDGIAASIQECKEAESVWANEFLRDDDGFKVMDALRDCLETLPEKQRQALDMRYRDRVPREAMGQRLAITGDGVKSLLRRIRSALAECIEKRLAEDAAS